MKLQDILSPENIRIEQAIRDKGQLLNVVAAECAQKTGLPPQSIAEALLAREKLGSTGLGEGIAIPHARLQGLTKPFAYAVRLRKPIEFEAVDDQPVDVIIALLLPQGADAENLASLAAVTRRLRDKAVAGRVRAAPSTAVIYQALIDKVG
jgi:PTS system nitrogen regulatory IIA component